MEFVDKESIVQWWHFIRVQIWRRIPDSCVQNNIDIVRRVHQILFFFSLFSQKSGPNNRWNQKDETGNISKTNSIKIGKMLATIWDTAFGICVYGGICTDSGCEDVHQHGTNPISLFAEQRWWCHHFMFTEDSKLKLIYRVQSQCKILIIS